MQSLFTQCRSFLPSSSSSSSSSLSPSLSSSTTTSLPTTSSNSFCSTSSPLTPSLHSTTRLPRRWRSNSPSPTTTTTTTTSSSSPFSSNPHLLSPFHPLRPYSTSPLNAFSSSPTATTSAASAPQTKKRKLKRRRVSKRPLSAAQRRMAMAMGYGAPGGVGGDDGGDGEGGSVKSSLSRAELEEKIEKEKLAPEFAELYLNDEVNIEGVGTMKSADVLEALRSIPIPKPRLMNKFKKRAEKRVKREKNKLAEGAAPTFETPGRIDKTLEGEKEFVDVYLSPGLHRLVAEYMMKEEAMQVVTEHLLRYEEIIRSVPAGEFRAIFVQKILDDAMNKDKAAREDTIQNDSTMKSIKCEKGCSHCCHRIVGTTTDEVLLLSGQIRQKNEGLLPDQLIYNMQQQAHFGSQHGPATDDVERVFREQPDELTACVFLNEDKECVVYDSRPLSCRVHQVTSEAERCSKESQKKGVAAGPDIAPAFIAELILSAAMNIDRDNFDSLPRNMLRVMRENRGTAEDAIRRLKDAEKELAPEQRTAFSKRTKEAQEDMRKKASAAGVAGYDFDRPPLDEDVMKNPNNENPTAHPMPGTGADPDGVIRHEPHLRPAQPFLGGGYVKEVYPGTRDGSVPTKDELFKFSEDMVKDPLGNGSKTATYHSPQAMLREAAFDKQAKGRYIRHDNRYNEKKGKPRPKKR